MAVPGLLLHLGLYISSFVCGIVAAASVTIVQGHFGSLCMLYGHVSYNATGGLIGVQSSSSPSMCYFVSAISIIVAVVCFSQTVSWVYAMCSDGDVKRERVWMNLITVVCGIFLFFLLVTGCILRVGRNSLCSSLKQTVPNITSCEDAQTRKWVGTLNGESFYSSLHRAETAVWVNFFFWLIIGVLVIVQNCRSSGSNMITGGDRGHDGPFGGSGATPEETEPFFNRPSGPQ
uniref:Transmembrane protein 179B n=1 Tax=Monopterus albus TaxID=43700 RepID=A0A3Q3K2F9_MONAL|nr:transmembrane protein 179B [Monopterus albus]